MDYLNDSKLKANLSDILDSDEFCRQSVFLKSICSSLITLQGTLDDSLSIKSLYEPTDNSVQYEENIAFSRKPQTEYDNIVNALTYLLLDYFVDKVEMEKCLVSERFEGTNLMPYESEETSDEYGQQQDHRNPSSEGSDDEVDNLYERKRLISPSQKPSKESELLDKVRFQASASSVKSKIKKSDSKKRISREKFTSFFNDEESLSDEIFSSEGDSPDDIDDPNYFSKYKGRDTNVVIDFKNGNSYTGRISCFMMEGEGKYTWSDGTKFEGTFIGGVAQGIGHFLWPDDSWYDGEMKNNLRHGKGVCVIKKNDKAICYIGKWKNGQRDGKGIIVFGDYDWYDGKWKNDKMHGFGLRQYPTGSRYVGEWKYGKPHGQGTMVWNSHDAYTGMWKNGKMHGQGTYTWRTIRITHFALPLQNMFDGSWKKGKRHGPGILLLASGAIISTFWINDKKEGPGHIICKNGLELESPFLFSGDNICNIGKPLIIPAWNNWYYDFLNPYQDGIVAPLNQKCESCVVYDEYEKNIGTLSERLNKLGTKRKFCLNNIPLLASVETMPLWEFIEKAIGLPGTNLEHCDNFNLKEEEMKTMAFEELWLRKVISNRMPDLNFIYQHYAKLGCKEKPECNCFLLRFMLWQLCLDCGIEYTCFTLCSLDNTMGFGNYPFDVVPMFEMINYLLCLTFEICVKKSILNEKIPGLWGAAFDCFVSRFIMSGIKKPNPMKQICTIIPIKDLYILYNFIKRPVTIAHILKFFCLVEENCSNWFNIPLHFLKDNGENLIYPDGSILFERTHFNKDQELSNFLDAEEYTFNIANIGILGEDVLRLFFFEVVGKRIANLDMLENYEVSFLEFCHFVLNIFMNHKEKLIGNFEENVNEEGEVSSLITTKNISSKPNVLTKDGGKDKNKEGLETKIHQKDATEM